LAKFGAPLANLKSDDLIDPNSFFRMGTAPHMIEILPRISGVDFDQAWERRIETIIDDQTGLKAYVISAEDLIANKRAFGRPYDLADADAVQTAQRIRPGRSASEPSSE
jgi:hypothetical protein